MRNLYLIIGLLFGVTACKETNKDDNPPVLETQAIVLNEGNFGWGNADIGIFDIRAKQYHPDHFLIQNKRPLGDVLQSAKLLGDRLFLVVNNSGVIEVVSSSTLKTMYTIKNMGSPRYMAIIKGGKEAFVTDIYGNEIRRIDLQTGALQYMIPFEGWSEHIETTDGKAFWVENKTKGKFFKIDAQINQCIDSTNFLDDVRDIVVLGNSIYGIYLQGTYLQSILLEGEIKEQVAELKVEAERIAISEDARIYYIRAGKLYKWDKGENWIANVPVQNLYGLKIDIRRGWIWVFDAADYTRNGRVTIIDESGVVIASFESGALPSDVVFMD